MASVNNGMNTCASNFLNNFNKVGNGVANCANGVANIAKANPRLAGIGVVSVGILGVSVLGIKAYNAGLFGAMREAPEKLRAWWKGE